MQDASPTPFVPSVLGDDRVSNGHNSTYEAGALRHDSRGNPGYPIHQGSPSPQYWNANLKRAAYPSPLSAESFSTMESVNVSSPPERKRLTPVIPNEVVPQHYISVTFATVVSPLKIEREIFVLVVGDQNEWFLRFPVFYERVDGGVLERLVIRFH